MASGCWDYPWDETTGYCYQKLPAVTNESDSSSLHLKSGQSLTLSAPDSVPTNAQFSWSGNIFARTGCASGTQDNKCQVGDCGAATSGNNYDSGAMCPPGAGGHPQGTLAEITMVNPQYVNMKSAGPDYYDISIINGINVSAVVGRINGKTDPTAPYTCTNAGSSAKQGPLPACTWDIKPEYNSKDYTTYLSNVALPPAVTPQPKQSPISLTGLCPNPDGGPGIPPNSKGFCQCTESPVYPNADGYCPDSQGVHPNKDGFFKTCSNNSSYPNSYGYCECTDGTSCAPGQVCGVALNASASKITQVCGTFIGWTTFDTLCSTGNEFLSFCTESVGGNGTVTDYLGCTGPAAAGTSCYNNATLNGFTTTCCGCGTSATAQQLYPGVWPTVQTGNGPDNGCYGNDTDWNNQIQSRLVYLKKACPTAYVYPFDDATSTFTCNETTAGAWPNYQITFGDLPSTP